MQASDDFNIFGPAEAVVFCGFAKPKSRSICPSKSYNFIETDPLAGITNTLTKMGDREEAAVQICLRPAKNHWQARGREILQLMRQGKSFHEAKNATGLLAAAKNKENEPPQFSQNQSSDEELMKSMESKLAKHCFETNIRVVVSIKDKNPQRRGFRPVGRRV